MSNPNPVHKFQKGEVTNPNGRPKKGQSLTDLMKEFLEEVPEGKEMSYKDAFVRKVYQKAMQEGSEACIRLIWNYIDGMPMQPIEHSGGDRPLGVVVLPELKIDEQHKMATPPGSANGGTVKAGV